jgi:hypothetical protein
LRFYIDACVGSAGGCDLCSSLQEENRVKGSFFDFCEASAFIYYFIYGSFTSFREERMVIVSIFFYLEMEMWTCSISCVSYFSDFFSFTYLLSDFYVYGREVCIGGIEWLIISLMFDDNHVSPVASSLCYNDFSFVAGVYWGSGFGGDVDSLVRANTYISFFEICS